MDERFSRSSRILGEQKMEKLNKSSVIVFGIGGVGGAVLEALVRGGIGTVAVVDKDTIDITNINRQIIALNDNIGEKKVDVAAKRALSINPNINFKKHDLFYLPETAEEIDLSEYDFIVDAIDNVTAKLELIERANELNIPVISSMGTGNKLHPELFEITDINKTSVCPLARVMRRELKNRGVKKLTVVYSKEEPIKTENSVPGSVSFTPPVAGYLMASYVINKLLEEV